MKRGLVVKDLQEIAAEEWAGRVAQLQGALVAEGVDVALIYGDVSRSDDIGYLTNLTIYWNEGVVAIPSDGEAALLTKLSPRVFGWMGRTSMIEDFRSGKALGALAQQYLEGREPGVLGLIEAALWPAAAVQELRDALPDWEIRELGSLVRQARTVPSPAEVALLGRGAGVVRDAVRDASRAGLSTHERVAELELQVRSAGFCDLLLSLDDSSAEVATIEARGEFRHGWLLVARSFGTAAWLPALREALDRAIAASGPGIAWAEAEAEAASVVAEAIPGATAVLRAVNQADIATNGELHEPPVSTAEGEVVAVVLEVVAPEGRAVIGDTVLITERGAEALTDDRV